MSQVNYSYSFDYCLSHISLSDINFQHVKSKSVWWAFGQCRFALEDFSSFNGL